jgi:hypothetical protein
MTATHTLYTCIYAFVRITGRGGAVSWISENKKKIQIIISSVRYHSETQDCFTTRRTEIGGVRR